MSRATLHQLARLGARRRLEELREEEATIRAAFPDLDRDETAGNGRRRGPGRRRKANRMNDADAPTSTGGKAKRRRKRRRMSADEKRAVSERMKKYWAGRRRSQG